MNCHNTYPFILDTILNLKTGFQKTLPDTPENRDLWCHQCDQRLDALQNFRSLIQF